jgi:hypothetical protein
MNIPIIPSIERAMITIITGNGMLRIKSMTPFGLFPCDAD